MEKWGTVSRRRDLDKSLGQKSQIHLPFPSIPPRGVTIGFRAMHPSRAEIGGTGMCESTTDSSCDQGSM